MNKKILTVLGAAVLLFGLASTAQAKNTNAGLPKFVHPEGSAADLRGDANGIGKFKSTEANKKLVFVNGRVSAVSASSISVDFKKEDGITTTYTFAVDTTTKIIRKFKATATIGEVAVKDHVKLWATKLEGGTAKLIWDKSIWWAVVKGTITALDTTNQTITVKLSWVVSAKHKPVIRKQYQLLVKTYSLTEYWQGTTAKAFTDLAVGQNISVRGSWNSVGKYLLGKKITILP
jgi:hypothetical protein